MGHKVYFCYYCSPKNDYLNDNYSFYQNLYPSVCIKRYIFAGKS